MPIHPEALVAAWGATTAGVVNPINPHLELKLVVSILNQVSATVLVTTATHGPSAADYVEEIRKQVPSLRAILLVDGDQDNFRAALDAQDGDRLSFLPDYRLDTTSGFLPTGGTTAAPKLVRLSNRGQMLGAWIAGALMGSAEDEVVGIGMPLFHVGGLLMLALRALVAGQTALLLTPGGFRDRDLVNNFWDIVREYGMTSVLATPTTAAAIFAIHASSGGLHPLRTFTCGGSPVPVELGRNFADRFGVHLREVWGATEYHGFVACQPQQAEPIFGSVGLPAPHHRVVAAVLEGNRFIRLSGPDEQGAILVAGPCVTAGYHDGRLDAGFFVTDGPDGLMWGDSGDLGHVDSDGYVWISGRSKDVIIRGGHNIDPGMIEEVLNAHPEVLLSAAIGKPDAMKGEMPIAYVELVASATVQKQDLLALCRAQVSERAACPIDIVILPKMPLTAVGKIAKPVLRRMAIEDVVNEIAEEVLGKGRVTIDVPEASGRQRVLIDVADINPEEESALKLRLDGFSFQIAITAIATRAA
jgi:fatty-acyl-CoA synthase